MCLSTVTVKSQIFQDSIALKLVKKNIDLIYNQQFSEAHEVYLNICQMYPSHPIVFILNGMMIYWENYPLLSTTPARDSFEKNMRETISLCENYNSPAFEPEFLLANLCARGMLLMFYADNELVKEAISLSISTYKYLRHSFQFVSTCLDLNYFTGVYNYYLEVYPKEYPVYRPVAVLIPGGDRELGLKQLKTAAVNSTLLRAESYFLLTYIYLNFENRFSEALGYSKTLHTLFPENLIYQSIFIKNMLLMREFDEAEKQIMLSSGKSSNHFFQAQLTIFRGIIQEKKYHNIKLAKEYYKKGAIEISNFGEYGNDYAAYAYYGLSRISRIIGDKKTSKDYCKKAVELADFKKVYFDD